MPLKYYNASEEIRTKNPTKAYYEDYAAMLDFSFDNEDFKIDNDLEDVSVSSLVKKMKSKQKKFFNINDEVNQLEKLLKGLPKKDECYKMLSLSCFV